MMSNKEQGLKPVLSPESVNITPGKIKDKRRRHSSDIVSYKMEPQEGVREEAPLTMIDMKKYMDVILTRLDTTVKKNDLKDLVTKSDLKVMDDRISAQGQEITQLMEEIKGIRTNFDSLQGTVDRQIAVNISGSVGHDLRREPGSTISNMATGQVNMTREGLTKCRNLVIEGLRRVRKI